MGMVVAFVWLFNIIDAYRQWRRNQADAESGAD